MFTIVWSLDRSGARGLPVAASKSCQFLPANETNLRPVLLIRIPLSALVQARAGEIAFPLSPSHTRRDRRAGSGPPLVAEMLNSHLPSSENTTSDAAQRMTTSLDAAEGLAVARMRTVSLVAVAYLRPSGLRIPVSDRGMTAEAAKSQSRTLPSAQPVTRRWPSGWKA